MQGRLLTIDTLEDPIIARDFADEAEQGKRDEQGRKQTHRQGAELGDKIDRHDTGDARRRKQARRDGEGGEQAAKDEGSVMGVAQAGQMTAAADGRAKATAQLSMTPTVSFRDDEVARRWRQRARRRSGRQGRPSSARRTSRPNNEDSPDGSEIDATDHRSGQSASDDDHNGNEEDDDDDEVQTVDTLSEDDRTSANTSDVDEREVTDTDAEDLQMRSGFFVPAILRRWHARRGQAKRERRRRAAEEDRSGDEEKRDGLAKEIAPDTRLVYRRTPVFSGTIAPFAIMLEIPGFTSKWYVRITPDGQPNVYRSNPAILDVGLAFSLASAVVANIAILGRFSERLRPRGATAAACLGFVLHDIINIVALISFGVIHAVDDGFTYSEAYWMTTASTCASICCTATLVVDYLRTKDFENAGSGLTRKQSQLVMVIMAFLAYISISALIFALVMGQAFLDAMYFSVESIATIGLGDITPQTTAARIVLFFIAPGGIILLAVTVAVARQTILEEFEDAYKRRRRLYKQRLAERQEQRQEHRKLRKRIRNTVHRPSRKDGIGSEGPCTGGDAVDEGGLGRVLSRQSAISSFRMGPLSRAWTFTGSLEEAEGKTTQRKHSRWPTFGLVRGWSHTVPRGQDSNTEADPHALDYFNRRQQRSSSPLSLMDADETRSDEGETAANNDSLTFQRTDSMATTGTAATINSQLQHFETSLIEQRKDIEEKFERYRKDLARSQRIEFWIKLGVSASLFACFWLVGAAIFSVIENWSYFDGFYFVFVVFTSIGYGDLHPESSSGRAFFIVWALFGVGTLTVLFSVISDAWGNVIQQRRLAKGKRAHRHSKLKAKLSRAFDKVLPPKVQERRRTERRRKNDASATTANDGDDHRTDSAEPKAQKSSPVSTTGILIGAAPLGEAVDEDGKRDGKPSSIESDSVESSKAAGKADGDPIDVSQMHLDLTETAMAFHRGAVGFMEIMREDLTPQIREVPEVVDFMRKLARSDHKAKLEEEEKERILHVAHETQEISIVRAIEQSMLIHDFETSLHWLIHKSSVFLDEIRTKEEHLQQAKDEARLLRQQLSSTGGEQQIPSDNEVYLQDADRQETCA